MLHYFENYLTTLVTFLLVYDTSSRETFDKLEEWLNEVEMYSTKKDIIKMLVGNKIDKVISIIYKHWLFRPFRSVTTSIILHACRYQF